MILFPVLKFNSIYSSKVLIKSQMQIEFACNAVFSKILSRLVEDEIITAVRTILLFQAIGVSVVFI